MRYFTFLSFLLGLSFSALLHSKKSNWSWPPTAKPASVDLSKFSLDPDLEVTLWAKSPMLYNPTNMAIDPQGRIWIAEGVNYREKLGIRREAGDRIMVLIDSDGDGSADQSKVFWQDPYLESPLGIAVFDNQIVISQPPDIVVLTDVDRNLQFDPSVDKKEVLLTGFNGRQHDHSLHSVTSGPDGKWYFNSGNCGAIFTDNSGKTFRMNTNYRGGASEEYFYTPTNELKGAKSDDGYVWSSGFSVRMNPDGTDAEIIGHGYRNSYEQVVSSMGDLFQSDNDDYSSCRNSYVLEYGSAGYYSLDGQHKWQASKRSGQAIQRAHWRQDNPGTFDTGDVYGAGGPTGVAFYENGVLGKKWEGTYLSCEATRNVVFGYHPKPLGATYSLDRFDFVSTAASASDLNRESEEEAEKRIHFRPADLDIGPDGAIYIADWQDERSGGHSTQDESASGAIYRIAPKNFKPVIPSLDLKNVEGAILALKSPNPAVRFLGFQALKKFGNATLSSVEKLIDHENPYIAARAIWLLPHLGKDGKKRKLLSCSIPVTATNDSLPTGVCEGLEKTWFRTPRNWQVMWTLAFAEMWPYRSAPFLLRRAKIFLWNWPKAMTEKTKITSKQLVLVLQVRKTKYGNTCEIRLALLITQSGQMPFRVSPGGYGQVMPSLTLSTVHKTSTSPSIKENLPSNRLHSSITKAHRMPCLNLESRLKIKNSANGLWNGPSGKALLIGENIM